MCCVKKVKEKCVTFCFIKSNTKVFPKSSGEGLRFCLEVRSLLSKLTVAMKQWRSKTQDYYQKLDVRVASRTAEQFKFRILGNEEILRLFT